MDREVARKERKRSHKFIGVPYGYIIGIPSTYTAATDLSENSDSSEFSEDGDTYDTATKRQRTQSPKKLYRDRYVNPNRKVMTGARTAATSQHSPVKTKSPRKFHSKSNVSPGARTAMRQHYPVETPSPRKLHSQSNVSPGARTAFFTHGLAAMRQHSPVKSNSPRKIHSKSNVSPGARTVLSLFANPDESLRDVKSGVKDRTSEKENNGDDRPAAKPQLSALKNFFHVKQVRRLSYVDPCKVSTGAKTGDRLSVFANPGCSLLNVKSGVKHRHSRKENNGDDLNLIQGHEFRAPLVRDVGTKFYTSPPLSGWRQGRYLGAGGFGKVYECIPLSRSLAFTDTDLLAVKSVKIEPQYTEMTKEDKAIRNEINILMKLRHERIVSFYGSEERDDHLHLFMDFMPGGSLSEHIKSRKVLFESESRRYTKQILEAVFYLHSKNIIHRDIKGSNVLLDGEGNVKLADFGLSRIIQKIGSKTDLLSHCGTPHWMAPEIIRGKGYGRKADIWSVGCTLVEMLTGRPPLYHLEPVAAIFEIGSNPTVPTLPEGVSQDAKEFIQAALTSNPLERPWSEELLNHKFILDATDW